MTWQKLARVFATQEPRGERPINLTPALDYGSIEYLLPKTTNIMDAGFATRTMFAKLNDFNPDTDYLLMIGDPVAMGILCAVASKLTGGRFTVLKWDRQERRYYPVEVDLNQSSAYAVAI